MSFSYDFEPGVLAKWKRLDTDLQEQALDAIEDALASPPQPARWASKPASLSITRRRRA